MKPVSHLMYTAAALVLPASLVQAAAETNQRWAVVVGIDDYAELEDLKFAGADVRSLGEELQAHGFAAANIFVLEDQAKETKYRPSKGNIERQLDMVMRIADQNDVLLVAFSGHGVHLDGKSYLCPAEAALDEPETLIPLDGVYQRLMKCPAALKVMLVDACRDDPRLGGRKGAAGDDVTNPFATALESPPQGIVLLNSCAEGQVSMEEKAFGHGVFMHFMLDGLRGRADDNRDGRLTLSEVASFAGLETKRYVARQFNGVQTPKLFGDLSIEALAFDLGARRVTAAEGLARPSHDGDGPDRPLNGDNFTNTLGMKFKRVPAGEFMMGSDESVAELEQAFGGLPDYIKPELIEAERPRHKVRITRAFELGIHEVRKIDFSRFVEGTDFKTDAEKDGKGGWGWAGKKDWFKQRADFNWRSWGVKQGDTTPVVNVSWNDAMEFCKWLGEKEGCTYRLPTEAEWEFACRAGTSTRFSSGGTPESLLKVGNVADWAFRDFLKKDGGGTPKYEKYFLQANDGHAFMTTVGRYRGNAFGIYDMHGNVAEWCADWCRTDYYENSPTDDPQGPAAGSFRVIRGGGWSYRPVNCRSACRDFAGPANRDYFIGFRVVRAR